MRRSRPTVIALVALLLTGGIATAAAAQYPDDLPDFSHAGDPAGDHPGLFTPASGGTDRPLLVVTHAFTDQGFRAPRTPAWVGTRVLGPSPSVAGYYDTASGGRITLPPAGEDFATPDDGVVGVTVGATDDWSDAYAEDADDNPGPLQDLFADILAATDDDVDFATFDDDGDGALAPDELLLLFVHPSVDVEPRSSDGDGIDDGGTNRGISSLDLDGVTVSGLPAANVATRTNPITIVHELAHAALDLRDTYGFGAGSLDLGGPTIGAPDATSFLPNAWHRLHWGWGRTIVAIEDGYRNLDPVDAGGAAYLLYDPARGEDDYFLVEHRRRAGADASASDDGLVVWRVADDRYFTDTDLQPAVELMRPDGARLPPACGDGGCYSGRWTDAFDPADGSTPQRTMTRDWLGGADADVAVRAVRRTFTSGDAQMRAYLDVRGPGVLVDGWSRWPVPIFRSGTTTVPVPVMNTGEAADSFTFELTDLPAGWSVAGPVTRTLDEHVPAEAAFDVTVPDGASAAARTLGVLGLATGDPDVSSADDLTLAPMYPDDEDLGDATDDTPADAVLLWRDHTRHLEVDGRAGEWVFDGYGRNLHSPTDRDHSRLDLPPLTDEAPHLPELAPGSPTPGEVDDCGTLLRSTPVGDERILLSAYAEATVRDRVAADADDRVRFVDPPGEVEDVEHGQRVYCPQDGDAGPTRLVYSYGDRSGIAPRQRPGRYDPAGRYHLSAVSVPPEAGWLTDQREAEGARSVFPTPCPGGFFPACQGTPRSVWDLRHPLDSGRADRCQADGCPDHAPFRWDGGPLRMTLAADTDLSFDVLDETGSVVAGAVQTDPVPAPDPQPCPNCAGSPGGVNQAAVPVDPGRTPPAPPSTTDGAFDYELDADLDPGLYVLRTRGPAGTVTMDFVPERTDRDDDGVDDDREACPAGAVTKAGFADVGRPGTHTGAIDCMAWWDIARGRSAAAFAPGASVTRAQMASFLERLLGAAGASLPVDPPDAFGDDDGSVHEPAIDRLAAAGVLAGVGDGRYRPGAAVSRAQLATMLARTWEAATGSALTAHGDRFGDDDGTAHEANINRVATAGITRGVEPGRFGPAPAVTRAQMASFLARLLDPLARRGMAVPPLP